MPSEISSLRATAHPIRLRMLSLLTAEALSAAEIARELRITQANASYHLRLLASAGLIEEAGEETIRGGVAKRYRHLVADRRRKPGAHDPEGTLVVWEAVAHELIRRAQEQRQGPSQLCDAELWVSPQTWEEARELTERAARLLHENALPRGAADALHVNATMALFPMSEPDANTDTDTDDEAER